MSLPFTSDPHRTSHLDPEHDPPSSEIHKLKSLVRTPAQTLEQIWVVREQELGSNLPLGPRPLPLFPQERRLADMESSQAQLRDTIQSRQLLPLMPMSLSQPLPLTAPSVNGDTT